MDDEERRVKLEAGKAKFAKFLKKKGGGERKRESVSKEARERAPADQLDHFGPAETESLDNSECLSSKDEEGDPKSSLSDEISWEGSPSKERSKCDLVIARQRILELQELVDGKNETVEMTLEENKDLKCELSRMRERSLSPPNSNDDPSNCAGSIVERYSQKVEEYKMALIQREEIIQQLTDRLVATLASRDEVQKDALVQSESLAREISSLKSRLKQATEVLLKQESGAGISPQELLEARNEVAFLKREILAKDALIETAKLDADHARENYHSELSRCQSLEAEMAQIRASTESRVRMAEDQIHLLSEENRELKLKLVGASKGVVSSFEEDEINRTNSDDSCSSLGSPSKQQGLIGKELFNLIELEIDEDDIGKIQLESGKGRASIYALAPSDREGMGYSESDSRTEPTSSELLEGESIRSKDVSFSLKAFESEKQALQSELENLARLFSEVNELKNFLSQAQKATLEIGSQVPNLGETREKLAEMQRLIDGEKLSKETLLEDLTLVRRENETLKDKVALLEENLKNKSSELGRYESEVRKLEEYVNGSIVSDYSTDSSIEALVGVFKMFQELRSQNQCLNSVLEESEYSKAHLEKSLLQLTEKYQNELQEKELALITVSENCLDNHLKNLEICNTGATSANHANYQGEIDESALAELERMSNAVSQVQILNGRLREVEDEKITLERQVAQLAHDLEELVEANAQLKSEKSRIEIELKEKVGDLEETKRDLEAHADKLNVQLNLLESAKEELAREVNLLTEKHDKWLLMSRDQLADALPNYVVEEHRNCAAAFLLLEERLRMEAERKNAILAQLAYYSKRNEQHEIMYREILKRYHEMKERLRHLWDERDNLKRQLMETKYEKGALEANVSTLKESLAQLVSSKESGEIVVKRVTDLGVFPAPIQNSRNFLGEEYYLDLVGSQARGQGDSALAAVFGETLLNNIHQVVNLKKLYKNGSENEAVREKVEYFCQHESERYSLYKSVIEDSRKTLKDLIWLRNALEILESDIEYEESETREREAEIRQCQNQLSSVVDAFESDSTVVKRVSNLGADHRTTSEEGDEAKDRYKECRFDLDESWCQKTELDKKTMYEMALGKLCDIEKELRVDALEKWNRSCLTYLEITVIKQKEMAKLESVRSRLAQAVNQKESRDFVVKNVPDLGGGDAEDDDNYSQEHHDNYDILKENSSLTDDTQSRSQMNTVVCPDQDRLDSSGHEGEPKRRPELFSDNSSSIKEEIEELSDSCISDDLYNILENQFLNGAANDLLENAEVFMSVPPEMDADKPDQDEEMAGDTKHGELEAHSGLADNARLLMELQNSHFEFIRKEIETHTVKMESAVKESYLEMIHKEKLVMMREILTKEKLESLRRLKNQMDEFHQKVVRGVKMQLEKEYVDKENKLREEFNRTLSETNDSYVEKLSDLQRRATDRDEDFKEALLAAVNEANLQVKMVEMNERMFDEMNKYKEEMDKRYQEQTSIDREISDIKKQIEEGVAEKTVYGSATYAETGTPFYKVLNDIAKEVTEHLNNLIKRWSLNVTFNLDALPKLDDVFSPSFSFEDSDEVEKMMALQNASLILDQKEKLLQQAKDAQDYLETYSARLKKLLKAMENDYELILTKKEEMNRECTEISDQETQTDSDWPESALHPAHQEETGLETKEEFWQTDAPNPRVVHDEEIEEKYRVEIDKLCSENAAKVGQLVAKHNSEIKGLTRELEVLREKERQTGDLGLEMSHLIQDHKSQVEQLEEQARLEADNYEKRVAQIREEYQIRVEALELELESEKRKLTEIGADHSVIISQLIQDHQSELQNLNQLLTEARNQARKLEEIVDEMKTRIEGAEQTRSKEIEEYRKQKLETDEEIVKLKSQIDSLKMEVEVSEELRRERDRLNARFSKTIRLYDYLMTKLSEHCIQKANINLDEDGVKTRAQDFTKNILDQINQFEISTETSEDADLELKILNLQQTVALDLETLIHENQRECTTNTTTQEEGSAVSLTEEIGIQQENESLKTEIGLLQKRMIELEEVISSLREELLKANSSKSQAKSSRDWLAGTDLSAADIQTWQVHTAQTNSRLMNVLSDLVKTFVDTEQTIERHLSNLGLGAQHSSSEGASLHEDENGPLSGTFHGSREDCTQLSSLGDAIPLEMCDDIGDLTPRAWDAVTNAIGGIQQEPETEGEDLVLGASRRLRAAVDRVLSLLTELIENSSNHEITDLILKNHKLVVLLKEESRTKWQLQQALNKAEEILASLRAEDGGGSWSLRDSPGDVSKAYVSASETSPKQVVQCLRKSKEDIIEDTTASESYSEVLKRDVESLTRMADSGEMKEDWKQLLKRVHYLELALEELSNQKEEMAEEKQKEIDDLKEQMEAMEKQMQSNKRFIEEQAHEREQEQEEFFRELDKIRDSLREREKSHSEEDEDGALLGQVELLEQQLKLKSQSCDDLRDKTNQLESRLRSSEEKINDLREVISEMENQLENKNKANEDLNAELEALRGLVTEHERAQSEMTSRIEELKTSLKKEYDDHVASLEERLQSKNQEMEQMAHCQTLMQEFRSQIHVLDERLESKIRMLEHFSWHASPGTSEDNSLSDSRDQEERLLLIQEGRVLSPRSIHGEEIKKLETKIDSLLNATDEAIKRLKDSEIQIRDTKFKTDELQTERALLQEQLNDQLYQISTLKTRMEDARYDVKSKVSSKELAQLKETLNLEKEKVKDLKRELETFRVNYPKIEKELVDAKATHSNLQREMSEQIERLEKDNAKVNEDLIRVQDELKVVLSEKELISNEMRELKSANEKLVQSQEATDVVVAQKQEVTLLQSSSFQALENDVRNLKASLLSEEKLRLSRDREIDQLESRVKELNGIAEELRGEIVARDEDLREERKRRQRDLEEATLAFQREMDLKLREIQSLKESVTQNERLVEDHFLEKLDAESRALRDTYEQSLNKIRAQHEESVKELEERLGQSFADQLAALKDTHDHELTAERQKWSKKLEESGDSHLSNQKCIFDDYEAQLEKLTDENKARQEALSQSERLLTLKENQLKELTEKCRRLESELERFRNNLLLSRDSTPESDATATTATSTGDEGSGTDSVKLPNHMQKLFDKVLKEGLEVLSLTERRQITRHVEQEAPGGGAPRFNVEENAPAAFHQLWLQAKEQLLEEAKALREITVEENRGKNDESISVILRDFLKREKNRLLIELQTYSTKEGHRVLSNCKELEDKIYSLEDRQEATLKELYELVHSQLSKEKSNNLQMEREILVLKDQVEKADWQIKKQRDLLEYKVKQEKLLRDEFQSSLERERVNNEQLSQQSRQMRSRCSELELSLSLRQAEFQKMQNELERARKETENFRSSAEVEKNRANSLLQALEAERLNFSQIHMALDSEREHRKTLMTRDQRIINKLQASVDVHQSYSESVVSSRTLSPEVARFRDDDSSFNLVLSANNSAIVPVKDKCLKCGFYENMLSQERGNWQKHEETMTRLLASAENEVAQLKQRILLSSSKNDAASSQRQKLLQVHWKYRKSEKHRASLVYQKRYLLKLLQGYQKTERATLSVLNEMGVCSPTSSTPGSLYEESYYSVTTPRRQKRPKFRSVVQLVIGAIRFKFLLDRSNQARQFFIYGKQQQQLAAATANQVLPQHTTELTPRKFANFAPYNEPYGLSHLFSSTSCSSSSSASGTHYTGKLHQQLVFDPTNDDQSCGSGQSETSNRDLTRGQRKLQECVLRLEHMHKALGLDA